MPGFGERLPASSPHPDSSTGFCPVCVPHPSSALCIPASSPSPNYCPSSRPFCLRCVPLCYPGAILRSGPILLHTHLAVLSHCRPSLAPETPGDLCGPFLAFLLLLSSVLAGSHLLSDVSLSHVDNLHPRHALATPAGHCLLMSGGFLSLFSPGPYALAQSGAWP